MNMQALMQQAQKMQKDMAKKQEEINSTVYAGISELVDVEVYGTKKIKKINIKNKDNFDAEDVEILEDMIKIAMNDAFSKVDKDVESKMGSYGKQLGGLL